MRETVSKTIFKESKTAFSMSKAVLDRNELPKIVHVVPSATKYSPKKEFTIKRNQSIAREDEARFDSVKHLNKVERE